MNILVTGGGGYIGGGLLLKLGEEFPEATITSLDNLTAGDHRHVEHLKKQKRFRLLVGDIRKRSNLREAFTPDTSMIIHLAAVAGVKSCNDQPKKTIDTNIFGTHLLLEQATNHNVERFVFTSSAAVYGTPQQQPISEKHQLKPINLYGVTKVSGEELMNACHMTRGLCTTTLRLSNVYGLSAYTKWKTVIPRFIWQATHDKPLTIRADGKQERNFVHVQDVMDAIIRCLKAPEQLVAGEIFNVGGESLSVNQIAEIVAQEGTSRLGKKISRAYTQLKLGEVYTPEFKYDCKKAFQKIGYKSKRQVSLGVSELFDYAIKTNAPQSQHN